MKSSRNGEAVACVADGRFPVASAAQAKRLGQYVKLLTEGLYRNIDYNIKSLG